MKSRPHILRITAVLSLLLVLFWTTSATGQEIKRSEGELLAAAKEIIAKARFCALITVGHTGVPHARTIDPFAPEKNWVVWFATNPNSRKVGELRENPQVLLYYFLPAEDAYVTISGSARLVNDQAEKRRRWKDEWKDFYPNRDDDYLLVEVTPNMLEVVNIAKGIVGNSRNWAVPTVKF